MNEIKNIIIGILISMLLCMGCIIFEQQNQINIMQSEIQANREFISTELHMIDSIYDNNYQLLKPDYCIDINMIHNMLVDIGYNIISTDIMNKIFFSHCLFLMLVIN